MNDEPLSSASSHHLVGAICSLPHLTKLRLDGEGYQEEFYSNLKKNASTLKVCGLLLDTHNMLKIWINEEEFISFYSDDYFKRHILYSLDCFQIKEAR